MILKNRRFFGFKTSSKPTKIEKLKAIRQIFNIENNETMNRYELRLLKKSSKILKSRNVKAKVFNEPQNITINNNLHKPVTQNELTKLAQAFETTGIVDSQIQKAKKEEKNRLINDSKTFKIKW